MRVERENLVNPAVTVRTDDSCFHCGKMIGEPPYVIWQGNSCAPGTDEPTQIGLHVECAVKLSDHLRADSQPRH